MVGSNVGAHPAVLYQTVVVADDAGHIFRIADIDVSVDMKVFHCGIFNNFVEQSPSVVVATLNSYFDGVSVAIECALIVMIIKPQRDPRCGAHVEVGPQIESLFVVWILTVCNIIPMITDVCEIGCVVNVNPIARYSWLLFRVAVPDVVVLCMRPLCDGAEQGEDEE